MKTQTINSATVGWVRDLAKVMTHGTKSSPRGMETVEMLSFRSTVDMNYPIVTSPARALGYRFLAAEAAWILSGDDRVSTIAPYSREISKFSDDGVHFFGAYGPKIEEQIEYVVATLLRDLDSRQAVINIWRESPPKSNDIPCTLSVQFIVREGKLHCVDTMRSSDLWLGHPYDVFNFSMLSLCVVVELKARGIEVELGSLALNAGSKHVYARNYDGVKRVIDEAVEVNHGPRVDAGLFLNSEDVVEHLWDLAKSGRALDSSMWT